MNEELTNEVLEAMKKCDTTGNCLICAAYKFCKENPREETLEKLCTAARERRAARFEQSMLPG